jgi:hypothetical protein
MSERPPREAALAVLAEARGEALHWTVVWDRALRAGYVNPLTHPDARKEFLKALTSMARSGAIEKTSTGTYRLA